MSRKILMSALILGIVFLGQGLVQAAEKAPQKVIDLANTALVKLGTDPVIVKAVKEENAKGKTLDQIKEMDKKWMATPGIADFMKVLMENECGKHIREIQKSAPYYAEIFVMDNQGANVAMTDKTSDYWQGDEDKFTQSYKGGQGAIHISDVKFDDSTKAYLVQVSVPVKDGDKVIGAITIGLDVEKIK
ncbi:MAG: PDC sensor domain-containing protein [Thermodesulfobacteriota bacterium]